MPELPLSQILRPELAELSPYLPTQGEFAVRLDANEAPPLLSDGARTRLGEAAAKTAWERYPDATAGELREAIAAHCKVAVEETLVGVGSDELLSLMMTVLSRARDRGSSASVLTTTPTFVMYRMAARVRGLRVMEVPLDSAWDLPTDGLAKAIEMSNPNMVFVASPNNPTGNLVSRNRLEQLIEIAGSALVVIDEAYVDYASCDVLDLYRAHANVAVLRTLSKVGFAALRVGWMLGRPELISELDKARLPYNVNAVSQRLATLVLTELSDDLRQTVSTVQRERGRVADALSSLDGIHVTPSEANFIWFASERPAKHLFEGLAERGILVRSFHKRGGRLTHQLRVTIGLPHENDRFLAALREVLA